MIGQNDQPKVCLVGHFVNWSENGQWSAVICTVCVFERERTNLRYIFHKCDGQFDIRGDIEEFQPGELTPHRDKQRDDHH